MTEEKVEVREMVRQGDILLVACDPVQGEQYADVYDAKTDIVAYGEATNHHHRVVGAAQIKTKARQMYVQVAGPAQMVHEEHGAVDLQEGWYEVRQQREYTPRSIRYVRD